MNNYVTISLHPETKQRIINLGAKVDSYDDILNRLVDYYEKQKEDKAR